MVFKSTIESCKGCYSNISGTCTYYFRFFATIEDCPCNKCIIKMVCKEACDEYRDLIPGNVTK